WRLAGWPREFGRAPGAEDLIVPHTKPTNRGPRVEFGGMRSDHDTYERHGLDCDAVGLRQRRVHDLRRTGITLAREDGADKDVLRFCFRPIPPQSAGSWQHYGNAAVVPTSRTSPLR
ncbi:MAG: hypothetical protein ACXWLR_14550, partial [Myxococcales bacterium]